MKFRKTVGGAPDKVEQQMTPMIDIVFQLLTFFIMSFRISPVEGDFNVKMPLVAPAAGQPSPDQPLLPPIQIQLKAGPEGRLAAIQLGDKQVPNFDALHRELIGLVGTNTGPSSTAAGAEVELELDYDLRYEHVIAAVSAISGHVDPASGNVVKLIEKIKFKPPQKPLAPGQ